MRIGIIGAGAAGLAAAYDLVREGHQVEVFERAPFVGGQASTFDVGGGRLERGYHHWFTSDTDILQLVDEIGLGHTVRWFDSKVGAFVNGRIYDFVTPMDLLKFKPLGLVDRLRLGLVTLMINARPRWEDLEQYTAAEWLQRFCGRRVYDVWWGPMLRGKFGEEFYDQVGMVWIWGKIHTRFASRDKGMAKEKLGYPMGSFGEVFEVLAQRVQEMGGGVHLSAPVRRIAVQEERMVGMEVARGGGDFAMEPFDAVIATVPSYVFPRLVPQLPADYLAKLTDVKYLSAVLVILVLDRPLSHIYWLNVADRSIPFVGVIEHTNMVPPEHYGGRHIVYLSNYLTTSHPLYQMEKEELLEAYLPHLKKINPSFELSWVQESYHHKVDAAQPIITTNYSARIPDHRTPFRGVYLANTAQIYPEDRGTNYSVRLGRQVARMLLEDLA